MCLYLFLQIGQMEYLKSSIMFCITLVIMVIFKLERKIFYEGQKYKLYNWDTVSKF